MIFQTLRENHNQNLKNSFIEILNYLVADSNNNDFLWNVINNQLKTLDSFELNMEENPALNLLNKVLQDSYIKLVPILIKLLNKESVWGYEYITDYNQDSNWVKNLENTIEKEMSLSRNKNINSTRTPNLQTVERNTGTQTLTDNATKEDRATNSGSVSETGSRTTTENGTFSEGFAGYNATNQEGKFKTDTSGNTTTESPNLQTQNTETSTVNSTTSDNSRREDNLTSTTNTTGTETENGQIVDTGSNTENIVDRKEDNSSLSMEFNKRHKSINYLEFFKLISQDKVIDNLFEKMLKQIRERILILTW